MTVREAKPYDKVYWTISQDRKKNIDVNLFMTVIVIVIDNY
jgi:hypothetical protein